MTSMPALLGALTAILQSDPLCQQVIIVETKEFSHDQYYFKVRAVLQQSYYLQVRVYFNRGHVDYAYQLFANTPILRWDNKEEFRQLATYPHHYHNDQGAVEVSPLKGDPLDDIQVVLEVVAGYIKKP